MAEDYLARYKRSSVKHGDSPLALQWMSYESAANRYRQLVQDINFQNRTILDAGCGMGDILPFIYTKTQIFTYHGVDMMGPFIATAQKRYPGHEFAIADPFADTFQDTYDIVVCSGVLNSTMPDWLEVRKQRIAKLFSLATEVLVFNMAGYPGAKNPNPRANISYAPTMDILQYCLSLTPKVILRHHYHEKDFTIVMFKDFQ